MKIKSIRLLGVRCFEDTGDLNLENRFNLIVGQNNAGKSTFLRSILHMQGMMFDNSDVRPGSSSSGFSMLLSDVKDTDQFQTVHRRSDTMRYSVSLAGDFPAYQHIALTAVGPGQQVFPSQRPHHHVVPFIAKRKAIVFNEIMNSGAYLPVTGTLQNLYSNVDLLATDGHPSHEAYKDACMEVLGLKITTQPSNNGKVAGFYLNADKFITLDRMGDGVAEIVALITELCLARDKIFVLEEPETNLHPKGLKSLLHLLRSAAERNQFIIATHSNVVVRELAGEPESSIFRVYRDGDAIHAVSKIEPVEQSTVAHMNLLRELGYEFTDFSLFEGWLFLEESSAEQVIRDILVPFFVPKLKGRLRTFSAAGVNKLVATLAEFRRLITFVHLQPAYDGRLWVRADGDEPGLAVIREMKVTFPNLSADALDNFSQAQFELYYPERFQEGVGDTLAIADASHRRQAKANLLREVIDWTMQNPVEAKIAWKKSADEIIGDLKTMARKLG